MEVATFLRVPRPAEARRHVTKLPQPRQVLSYGGRLSDGSFRTADVAPPLLRDVARMLPLSLGDPSSSSSREFPQESSDLDPVLECMAQSRIDPRRYGVVSFRHNLLKLMKAPYSDDVWEMDVEPRLGTVYLGIRMPEDGELCETEWQRKCAYWGHAFEADATEKTQVNVGPYSSVTETKLGSTRVLLASEIDATRKSGGRELEDLVEIKTHSMGEIPAAKKLNIWAQSYIAGVPTVLVGHRDDGGVVRRISTVSTCDMARGPDARAAWDPAVCLSFLEVALSWLQDVTRKCPDGDRFVLDSAAPGRLTLRKVAGEHSSILNPSYLEYLHGYRDDP